MLRSAFARLKLVRFRFLLKKFFDYMPGLDCYDMTVLLKYFLIKIVTKWVGLKEACMPNFSFLGCFEVVVLWLETTTTIISAHADGGPRSRGLRTLDPPLSPPSR